MPAQASKQKVEKAFSAALPKERVAQAALRNDPWPTKTEVEMLAVMRDAIMKTLWPDVIQEDPVLAGSNRTLKLLRKQAYTALVNAEEQIQRYDGRVHTAIVSKLGGKPSGYLEDWKARAEFKGLPESLAGTPEAFARALYQSAFIVQQDMLSGLHNDKAEAVADKLREIGQVLVRRLGNNFGIGMLTGYDARTIVAPESYGSALVFVLNTAVEHNLPKDLRKVDGDIDMAKLRQVIQTVQANESNFVRPPEALRTSQAAIETGAPEKKPSPVPHMLEKLLLPVMGKMGKELEEQPELIELQKKVMEALQTIQEFFAIHDSAADALFQVLKPENVQNLVI